MKHKENKLFLSHYFKKSLTFKLINITLISSLLLLLTKLGNIMECVATQLQPVYKQQSIKQVENYNQKPIIDIDKIDLNNLPYGELTQAKLDFEFEWEEEDGIKKWDLLKKNCVNIKHLDEAFTETYPNKEKYIALKVCITKLKEEKRYTELSKVYEYFENNWNVKFSNKLK